MTQVLEQPATLETLQSEYASSVERNNTTLTALGVLSLETLMELGCVDAPPQTVTELMRQAYAAGLVTGPEAFQAVSKAYSEREVYGLEELSSYLGKSLLSQTSMIASGPTASYRTLVKPVTK